MLSVILYGRNDSHGYNLHKRAAISFNAIAELLDDPADEIVFVDYNTPDDLPTFPEAIHDTLTRRTIERLRVLRVRPRDHQRFLSRSHLVALEPVARNVALRRSNPANRWVLSTNTDMIFAPNREGRSLSDIVAKLEDGFYHLPRFELPECLWESFDRKDGAGIISRVRDWGMRYHINEIVHSGHDNLYDAPGDFQLALRSDLFDIHGFHEDMLLGWHVDANIARRMRMLRGEVRSLADDLIGFHCDHTRQATAVHKRDRVENDQGRFVHNIVTPGIATQAQSWGLADVEIEEIRLDNGASARYVKALDASITRPADAVYEARYVSDSYNTLDYPAEHVLPYIADLLSCSPAGVKVGYAGVRKDMFDLVNNVLNQLDPTTSMEAAPGTPWLNGADASKSDAAWTDAHDLYIFEVGETPGINEEQRQIEARRLSSVFALFRRFTQREEDRQVDERLPPRRVIAINAIHTYFEILVSDTIAHTTTPFSTRVRHGYVASDRLPKDAKLAPPDLAKVGEMLAIYMNRTYAAPVSEVKRLIEIARTLTIVAEADTTEWTAALNVAEPLLALIRDGRTMAAVPRDPAELAMIGDLIEAHRPSVRPVSQGLATFPLRDGPSTAATRLADVDDWNRPSWVALARRYWRAKGVHDYFARTPGAWEQTTLLEELDREFDFASRLTGERPRILVVAHDVAYIAACLLDLGAEVDILDPLYLLDEPGATIDWRPNLRGGFLRVIDPVGSFVEKLEAGRAMPYDAIICPHTSAFIRGRSRIPDLIAGLHPWLKQAGLFALTGLVRMSGEPDRSMLPRRLALQGKLATGMEAATGFKPLRDFDFSLSRRTADSRARSGAQPAGLESFISGEDGLSIRGVWFWRLGADARLQRQRLADLFLQEDEQQDEAMVWVPPQVIRAQAAAQIQTAPKTGTTVADIAHTIANGNQMARVQASGSGKRTPRGVSIDASSPPGPFATASLGIAAPGAYELIVEVAAKGPVPGATAFTVEIASGDTVISETSFTIQEIASKARRSIEFDVPVRRGGGGVKPLEVRMVHHGICDMQLLNLSTYSGARV